MIKFFFIKVFILCTIIVQGQTLPGKKIPNKSSKETISYEILELKLKEQLSSSGFRIGKEIVDPVEIPDLYSFDFKYSVKVNSKKGEKIIHYLIKNEAPYFGVMVPNSKGLIAVIDTSRGVTVLFTNSGKIKNISAIKNDHFLNTSEKFLAGISSKYSYKTLGRKYILGFESSGYQTENKDGVYTFYLTTEPKVSFPGIFLSEQSVLPPDFDDSWLTEGKGLLMLMTVEGRKNVKNNITMTCVGFENYKLVLEKKNFLSYAGPASKVE